MRHVGCHLVGGGLRNAVRRVGDVLLRRPRRDVNDQPAPGRHHEARGMLAGDECRAHAGRHHGVPAPQRLLPERGRKGEVPVFDHPFVAAPRGIHEDVQSAGLSGNPFEHLAHCRVIGVIAGHSYDVGCEVRVGHTARCGEHVDARRGQAERHAAADTAARAGHKGHLLAERGGNQCRSAPLGRCTEIPRQPPVNGHHGQPARDPIAEARPHRPVHG
jgi:hypothetical protein